MRCIFQYGGLHIFLVREGLLVSLTWACTYCRSCTDWWHHVVVSNIASKVELHCFFSHPMTQAKPRHARVVLRPAKKKGHISILIWPVEVARFNDCHGTTEIPQPVARGFRIFLYLHVHD